MARNRQVHEVFYLLFLDTKWIYISTYVGRRLAGGSILSEWKVTFECPDEHAHSLAFVKCRPRFAV